MTKDDLERFETELLPLIDDAYSLARRLLRDEHDAQDVVQEAYLRALRYWGGQRGEHPRAWLLTIVRHCCYTWTRRQRADRPTVEYDEERHGAEAGKGYAADAQALENDRLEELERALDRLPMEFREAVVLREVEGLSYKQIARIIGAPIGTVMSRLSRGRRLLQAALGAEGQEVG